MSLYPSVVLVFPINPEQRQAVDETPNWVFQLKNTTV